MTLLQRFCLALLFVTTFAIFAVANTTRDAEEEVFKSIFDPARKYNKLIRPPSPINDESPILVIVSIFVWNIGEINDETKDYQVSLTLRQQWKDSRLSYIPNNPKLKYVTSTDAGIIWVPHIFFSNEKTRLSHELVTPNTFIRIYPSGEVQYISRVSLKLSCEMYFKKFPMDQQNCDLLMTSYAYNTNELILIWSNDDPIQLAKKLDLAPYELHEFGNYYCNAKTKRGQYSCLQGSFLFTRMLRPWLMQATLPLGLLVVVSWITFWLDERAVVLRVIIAVIVVVATVSEVARVFATIPHSGYVKHIDVWICWMLFLVFLTLIEQLVVILVTSRDPPAGACRFDREIEERGMALTQLIEGNGTQSDEMKEVASAAPCAAPIRNLVKKWLSHYNLIVRCIDMMCRVLFPVGFLILNLIYWTPYTDYE